jgi:hypothetical protein
MQKFEYRSPRFTVDLPVLFASDHTTVPGRCTDISREGMRLEMQELLPKDSEGTILIQYQNSALKLLVRVTHSSEDHEGVEFVYRSDRERRAVAHLAASVLSGTGGPRLMLLQAPREFSIS